ncbi:treslin-like [Penaeus indicus]|uniref:treslin-like n=1 Tax=Penaeus indicus TaxID=29960 RepID=UPI00300D125A
MFSSVQAVFLIDVNSFVGLSSTERELERNVARLKLGCLKVLTECGARTERGCEEVRWACKYYDSLAFRPDTARKSFVDFNRTSFDEFDNDVTDRFCKAFDGRQAPSEQPLAGEPGKPHCYILKKALQEVLLDYNWDRPDISSPVKTNRRRTKGGQSKLLPDNVGPYNSVIVCTRVPHNLEGVRHFCGCDSEAGEAQVTAEDFLGTVVDPALLKGFQEDKQIHLNFINVSDAPDTAAIDPRVTSTINAGLSKLNGSLHPLSNIVQSGALQIAANERVPEAGGIFPSPPVCVAGIGVQVTWWKKTRGARPRRPQPGPFLVWEDAEGISYLKVQLEVLAVHGSSSQEWGNAVVVGVVRTSAVSVLAVAGGTGHLYVCHAPNTVFTTLISVLAKYQLSVLLKLNCGGVAVLCPWAGGVGCLAVISASGLATPPLHSQAASQETRITDPGLLNFVAQTVEKCLKNASPHMNGETVVTTKRFSAHQTERWYRPLKGSSDAVKQIRKKRATRMERKAMQERLQKRYRPQIPCPLSAGEMGPVDLVDVTQPLEEAGPSKKPTMSRAQQLVKKSHIVTAQQKVKEQRAEEEERVQATERRAAQASEQARKSQALESQVLNKVSDIQDTEKLIQTLKNLCNGDGIETDLFTSAQTVINLALMHVKNSCGKDMEGGLRKLLGSGVMQTTVDINNEHPPESHLHHYKLQTLLHLELLWVLGYSSSGQMEDEEEESRGSSIREHHVEEAVKMLRAISLRHNPTTMATFLQETVLENYVGTLGEVLVEIYEELNQPLPGPLKILTGDLSSVADTRPNSVKSHASSVVSYDSTCGSVENPGSGKSREGRRMSSRHPSLKETSKRTIVIPVVTRALRRTTSEQTKQAAAPPAPVANKASESTDNDIKKVCRNLFDLSDGAAPKPKLQRSMTVGSVPVAELRRSPRKKHRKSTAITPRKSRILMKQSKGSHKTPVKGMRTAEKGMKTPKSKKGGVIVPETPGDKVGQTMFNKRRIRKSTGTTLVTESPDIKRVSKTTPRRLQASLTITRRNSFYSGARSRNWERGKTQLLADHIRSHSERRSLDSSAFQSVGDASFLFSEILSASQSDLSRQESTSNKKDCNDAGTPERRVLDYGLDTSTEVEESSETVSSGNNVSNNTSQSSSVFSDSPAKNSRAQQLNRDYEDSLSRRNLKRTPVKAVKRALSLCTPTKTILVPKSPRRSLRIESGKEEPLFCTPKKVNDSPFSKKIFSVDGTVPGTPKQGSQNKALFDTSLSTMTPSKRVQFSLTLTPSKRVLMANNPQTPKNKLGILSSNPPTPKSILKTPSKTPGKTPVKANIQSPDIFATTGKKEKQTPAKTPLKGMDGKAGLKVSKLNLEDISERVPETPSKVDIGTPVKVGTFVCNGESEIELLSPVKGSRSHSTSSVLLYTPEKKYPLAEDACIEGESENLSGNTDHGPDISVETLKGITPEDVELMNTLMFGKEQEESSEIAAAEISEDDDFFKLDINGILCSLSSPTKQASNQSPVVSHSLHEDLVPSLGETKTPLLDLNAFLNEQVTPEKNIDSKPCSEDLLASPEITLDPKMKRYIERMNQQFKSLENSAESQPNVAMDETVEEERLKDDDQVKESVESEITVDADKESAALSIDSDENSLSESEKSHVTETLEVQRTLTNKSPEKDAKEMESERRGKKLVRSLVNEKEMETLQAVAVSEESTCIETKKDEVVVLEKVEQGSDHECNMTLKRGTRRSLVHSEPSEVSKSSVDKSEETESLEEEKCQNNLEKDEGEKTERQVEQFKRLPENVLQKKVSSDSGGQEEEIKSVIKPERICRRETRRSGNKSLLHSSEESSTSKAGDSFSVRIEDDKEDSEAPGEVLNTKDAAEKIASESEKPELEEGEKTVLLEGDVINVNHMDDVIDDKPKPVSKSPGSLPSCDNSLINQPESRDSDKKSKKTTKRKIFESDDEVEETVNQENIKRRLSSSNRQDFKRRKGNDRRASLRKQAEVPKRKTEERTSKRSCVRRIPSFKEYSSEDEDYIFETHVTSPVDTVEKKADAPSSKRRRIFEDDDDFISPLKADSELMPLKNVENLPHNNKSNTVSVENDVKKAGVESSKLDLQDSPLSKVSTPDRCKQQKIDIYLSPIHKQAAEAENVTRLTTETSVRKRPETPNDWKRVKPRANKSKNSKLDIDSDAPKSTTCQTEAGRNEEKPRGRTAKRKRRGVKLKLTKSGDHYQVSEANASVGSSDLNSSSDMQVNSATNNDKKDADNSLDSSSACDTPVSKKKKGLKEKSIITPLRFTRHMSKDLSVSPEFFQKLITLSPERGGSPMKNSKRKSDEALGHKLEREMMEQQNNGDDSISTTSSIGHCNSSDLEDLPFNLSPDPELKSQRNTVVNEEWTVQNVPGSPTMKTFIRKQKNKHSIHKSPRIELSPIQSRSRSSRLSNPSMLSLVHLSVSPIINNKVNMDTHESQGNSRYQQKPKSSRRLYRSSKNF